MTKRSAQYRRHHDHGNKRRKKRRRAAFAAALSVQDAQRYGRAVVALISDHRLLHGESPPFGRLRASIMAMFDESLSAEQFTAIMWRARDEGWLTYSGEVGSLRVIAVNESLT